MDEAGDEKLIDSFEAAVPYPGASNLIFYPEEMFDSEPTAEQIVDVALGLEPGSSNET